MTANVLGALFYRVPYAVGIGYTIGYGFGDAIHRLGARVERAALLAALVLVVVMVIVRMMRARHADR